MFFTQFQFTVTYKPGTKNAKADALSRVFREVIPETRILAPIQWDIMTEISQANARTPPPTECPPTKTYVPENLRATLLELLHASPSSGHPGISRTIHLVQNQFWWPSLPADAQEFVRSCAVCNTSKSSHQLPAGLLLPLPTPQRPWSHIALDFVTNLPRSNNCTVILTIIDRFSKACRLVPLPELPTAFETAEALCDYVFHFYNLPEDIVSDRGPVFTSRVWSAFSKQLNVNVSGYHP